MSGGRLPEPHKHFVHSPWHSTDETVVPTDDWLECAENDCELLRLRERIGALAENFEGYYELDGDKIATELRALLAPPEKKEAGA